MTSALALLVGLGAGRSLAQSSPVFIEQTATELGAARGDWFGEAVAMSGNIAVIGAPLADGVGIRNSGAANVFVRYADAWILEQRLFGSGSSAEAFGSSVAMDGNTLVVGAPAANSDEGAAYVFQRDGQGWQLAARLRAPDPASGARFGAAVATGSGLVAVGAPSRDGAEKGQGAVYVFSGSSWTATHRLTVPDESAHAKLGAALAVSSDGRLLAGAPGSGIGGAERGTAYLFEGTTGSVIARIQANDGRSGDSFGCSVALNGVVGVIGACAAEGFATDTGAVYVYEAGSWALLERLTASNGNNSSWFGSSVAASDDTIIVGAPGHAPARSGAVYLFRRVDGGYEESLMIDGPFGVNGRAGTSVALSGPNLLYGAPLALSFGAARWAEVQAPAEPSDEWMAAGTSASSSGHSVSVSAPDSEVFTVGSVTATVTSDGSPAAGVVVSLAAGGATPWQTRDCMTNAAGQCPILLIGPAFPADHTVTVCVQGVLCATATKRWLLPTSTSAAAEGGGVLQSRTPAAAEVHFSLASARGNCVIRDAFFAVTVRCVDAVSFVRDGPYAYLYGYAEVNGVSRMYRLDVKDGGQPPGAVDTLTFIAEHPYDDYALAGTVGRGNVVVR